MQPGIPVESITVAVDGSLPSQYAAQAGIAIAKVWNLTVQGIYVTDVGQDRRDLKNDAEQEAYTALDWLEAECQAAGLRVVTHIYAGSVPQVLLARSEPSVLFAFGRRGINHLDSQGDLGENVFELMHKARIPVLIGGSQAFSAGSILVIFGEELGGQEALSWASRLQSSFGSHVVILIAEQKNNLKNSAIIWQKELIQASGMVNYQVVRQPSYSIPEEVSKLAEALHPGLIIMEKGEQPITNESFLENVLEKILRKEDATVLVA